MKYQSLNEREVNRITIPKILDIELELNDFIAHKNKSENE